MKDNTVYVTATYTQRNLISCVDITKTSPKKVKTRRGDNRRRGEGRMGEEEKEEWRRGGGKMGMKGRRWRRNSKTVFKC